MSLDLFKPLQNLCLTPVGLVCAFLRAQRNELQFGPHRLLAYLHNTCVLVTEGFQGIQAMASSAGKHQDKISSLVNKIRIPSPGPGYAQPLAPLTIKERSGKGSLFVPAPLVGVSESMSRCR